MRDAQTRPGRNGNTARIVAATPPSRYRRATPSVLGAASPPATQPWSGSRSAAVHGRAEKAT